MDGPGFESGHGQERFSSPNPFIPSPLFVVNLGSSPELKWPGREA